MRPLASLASTGVVVSLFLLSACARRALAGGTIDTVPVRAITVVGGHLRPFGEYRFVAFAAEKHAREVFGEGTPDFSPVLRAARRFVTAGRIMQDQQQTTTIADDVVRMNDILIQTERDLLLPNGLPKRPWFRHSIFAPADMKGYSASVIPGVNEAIEYGDLALTTEQISELAKALNRAATRLESYRPSEEEIMRAKR